MPENDHESPRDSTHRLVCELLVAIRGKRSQAMLARRARVTAQRIAAWERGRRAPSLSDVLKLARAARIDVDARFAERLPALADVADGDFEGGSRDAAYARALVGTAIGGQSAAELARTSRIHRATLASWLRGATEPRMNELIELFASAHYDPSYVVSLFVDPTEVPLLRDAWETRIATTRLFEELPDAFAMLAAIDTPARTSLASIVRCTGQTKARAQLVLARLEEAGHVVRRGRGWARGGAEVWLLRPARVQRFYAFAGADQIGRDARARRGLHVGAIDAEGRRALVLLSSKFMRDAQAIFAAAKARDAADRVLAMNVGYFDVGRVDAVVQARAMERSRTNLLAKKR